MTPDDIRTLARKAKLWTGIFQFAGNNDPDNEQRGAQPPTGHYPMEEIRETWEALKAVDPVNSPEDSERRMAFLTDDAIMQNPMMYAKGREQVRLFMNADLYWSPPHYYWEAYGPDRVTFKWSQHPRRNTKEDARPIVAISTWTYAGNVKFSHYYARWCRADITRVFLDAGLLTTIEAFCGAPFTDILPTPIATSHHPAQPPHLVEVA